MDKKEKTDATEGTSGNEKQEKPRRSVKGNIIIIESGNIQTPPPLNKCGLCLQLTFLLTTAAINVMCIVIGVQSIGKCPVQEAIPYYLLLKGVLGSMDALIFFLELKIYRQGNPTPSALWAIYMVRVTLCTLNLGLLIFGSVKVYSIFEPMYEGTNYCDRLCYLMAFTVLTYAWVVLILALVSFCCAFPIYFTIVQTDLNRNKRAVEANKGSPTNT